MGCCVAGWDGVLTALWVQLSINMRSGRWPDNALKYCQLIPISCHFRHCKVLLCMSSARKQVYSKGSDLHFFAIPLISIHTSRMLSVHCWYVLTITYKLCDVSMCWNCTSFLWLCKRHRMPFMGQPDYRVYEMNRRLQQWTEVYITVCCSNYVNFMILCPHSTSTYTGRQRMSRQPWRPRRRWLWTIELDLQPVSNTSQCLVDFCQGFSDIWSR